MAKAEKASIDAVREKIKKRKAAPAEPEPVVKKKRVKAVEPEPEVKKKKSKKVAEPEPEVKKKKKKKTTDEDSESEESPKKKKSKGSSAKEEAKSMLGIVDYDAEMDIIEKKYDTGSSQLAADHRAKLSTGLLVQDLVLSGGLLGGGWYTYFGAEQSAKSTLSMQSIVAALHTDVPLIGYYDYEGCYTFDTNVMVGGKEIPFSSLVPKEILDNLPSSGFLDLEIPDVNTLGGTVKARVFYGGVKECLKVTTETGNTLEGSRHPFMVQLPDGCLAWKMIEELSVGDVVLQQG